MQAGHHDLERRDARKLRVVLDRNAAAVVGHRQEAVLAQVHLDAGGVAGDCLVHRVVDDFGKQVVQGVGVGATDIHARTATHRLEAFKHLDVGGGIGMGDGVRHRGRGSLGGHQLRLGAARRGGRIVWSTEQVFDRHESSVSGARIAHQKLARTGLG
jgi:hypothetical protein